MKTLCCIFAFLLVGCKKLLPEKVEEHPKEEVSSTEEQDDSSSSLASYFPLLPLLEQPLWQKLLAAEKNDDVDKVKKIIAELKQLHPFKNDKTTTTLGGVTYDKLTRKITIPASVNYPPEGDKRHPQELELILCSNAGRAHETLFTTEVNPLHLEVLLHLAGYKKSPHSSKFQLQVLLADQSLIPIRQLLQTINKKALPGKNIVWEFSGSDFANNFYSPEQTGDLIICWHVHDSVLRISDEAIGAGDQKLLPVKHPKLTPSLKVHLVLSPEE